MDKLLRKTHDIGKDLDDVCEILRHDPVATEKEKKYAYGSCGFLCCEHYVVRREVFATTNESAPEFHVVRIWRTWSFTFFNLWGWWWCGDDDDDREPRQFVAAFHYHVCRSFGEQSDGDGNAAAATVKIDHLFVHDAFTRDIGDAIGYDPDSQLSPENSKELCRAFVDGLGERTTIAVDVHRTLRKFKHYYEPLGFRVGNPAHSSRFWIEALKKPTAP